MRSTSTFSDNKQHAKKEGPLTNNVSTPAGFVIHFPTFAPSIFSLAQWAL